MRYAGESSTYTGRFNLNSAGKFQVQILAMDPPNANFGMVEKSIVVAP